MDPRASSATALRPPRMDETLVILVRHGESTWNTEHRFQGQTEGVPLSPLGQEQVQSVARWLSTHDLGTVHIYSSDMLRARQTAEAIAQELGVTVEYTPSLREMNLGAWQGLTRDQVNARWPGELDARHLDIENHRVPGGESGAEIRERALGFYTELLSKHRGDTVILVSHGGTLAVLRSAIHDWNLNEAWVANRTRLPNTGVTALRYHHSTGTHELVLSASVAHLDGKEARKGDAE